MPKLSIIPTIITENILSKPFRREPEPDLIMDDDEQVESFENAGRVSGALDALYIFHVARASKVIQGCKTVVDLGCGPGVPLIKLARLNPDIQFIGLDLSLPMLERAKAATKERKLNNLEFRVCDITNLTQFSDHSIDGVISMQAFHHLPSLQHLDNTFKEVHRVLKDDGAIYFQDLTRLKSRHSAIKFAYYDPNAPYLTQLDGERSMRAAFSNDEYKELANKYLPKNVSKYKTALAELYMVLKTPNKELPKVTEEKIKAMTDNMRSHSCKFFKDIQLFHRLGGLG